MESNDEAGPADPRTIYRCESCQGTVLYADITEGGCSRCGGRRMRAALHVTDAEIEELKGRGYEFDERWSDEPVVHPKHGMARKV